MVIALLLLQLGLAVKAYIDHEEHARSSQGVSLKLGGRDTHDWSSGA